MNWSYHGRRRRHDDGESWWTMAGKALLYINDYTSPTEGAPQRGHCTVSGLPIGTSPGCTPMKDRRLGRGIYFSLDDDFMHERGKSRKGSKF